jgi:hypothetical protein
VVAPAIAVVEIEHEDPERVLGSDRTGELLAQAGQSEPPVIGVRKGVHGGQAFEAIVGQGVVDRETEVGPQLLEELHRVALEEPGRCQDDRSERHTLEREGCDEDLAGGLADEERVDDQIRCVDPQLLRSIEAEDPSHVVAPGEPVGPTQAVAGQGLHLVLARDEDRPGVDSRVAQQPLEGGVAETLELKLGREHGAEVAHRALDGMTPRQRSNKAIEGTGARPDLVIRVDREGALPGITGTPVVAEDGLGQLVLHRPHPLGEEPEPAADDEAGEPKVDGADDEPATSVEV